MTRNFTKSFWPSLPRKIIGSRFTRITLSLAISAMIVESFLPPRMLHPDVTSGTSAGDREDRVADRLFKSALTDAVGSTFPTLEGTEAVKHVKQRKLYGSLREAMQAAVYQIEREAAAPGDAPPTYHAFNPANNLDAYFTPEGTQLICRRNGRSRRGLACGEARLSMELKGYGYGQDLTALDPVASDQINVSNQRIENARTAAGSGERVLTEWYENKPDGLEQGFTIAVKPKVAGHGTWLNISLEVKGSLRAKQQKGDKGIFLETDKGERVLAYGGLRAEDSVGRELTARMSVEGTKVGLMVDDQEAVYPLTIDPTFVFQQKVIAGDGQAGDLFGYHVAISGDTALVGAFGVNSSQGAAYVFVRNGSTWSQQQKLTAADGQAGDQLGWSVSINGDTAVVGAPGVSGRRGAAYLFVRNSSTWSQQQKLTAADEQAGDLFGYDVAVSGDTALVGAEGVNGFQGAAYVFVRSSSAWSQQQKLTAADGQAFDEFGISVSVSGDTALIGAPGVNGFQGAVYVFVRTSGAWSQQQKLTAADGQQGDAFGSVSISGVTAVVGAEHAAGAKTNQGAAYVFVSNSGVWSQQQKLTAADGEVSDAFGGSVSVSVDTVVVGATSANVGRGAVYVFVRNSGVWSQQQKLTAPDGQENDGFGFVSIAGNTAVVGAFGANSCQGAAYLFLAPCPTIAISPSSLPSSPVGSPYPSTTFTQSGGVGSVTFSESGTLPTGLAVSTDGVLSGTPTQTGHFPITVSATDSNGCTGAVNVIIVIDCQTITVDPTAVPVGTVGFAYSANFTEVGGIGTIRFSEIGALPTGLTFSAGVLSGTPTQTGLFTIAITATDSNNCAGTRDYTISVVVPSNLAPRTFASGSGNDNNPCNLGAPCRTIGAALNAVAAGGEVVVLDSAGYGPFLVNKAVTIVASQGVYAGVSVFSGDGITIGAGPADLVILRGLTVNGLGGSNGIVFNSGRALFVERCVINGFLANGLNFKGVGWLFSKDSTIRNNAGAAIRLAGSMSALASASIDSVRLEANGAGLVVFDGGRASIRNSVLSGNSTGLAVTPSMAPAEINIDKCLIANNGTGVLSQGSGGGIGTIRIAKCVITDNGLGLSQQTLGVLLSGGRNKLGGNATNSTGTIGNYTVR
jgi:hypothetical protein